MRGNPGCAIPRSISYSKGWDGWISPNRSRAATISDQYQPSGQSFISYHIQNKRIGKRKVWGETLVNRQLYIVPLRINHLISGDRLEVGGCFPSHSVKRGSFAAGLGRQDGLKHTQL